MLGRKSQLKNKSNDGAGARIVALAIALALVSMLVMSLCPFGTQAKAEVAEAPSASNFAPNLTSTLMGLLFSEVNEVHLTKQGDSSIITVKGKAWMWNHNVTFRLTDNSTRQCLNNFIDQLNNKTLQLQFGGYYSTQNVDQPNKLTTTEMTVITECYFR
jgi:hypothetical protein